MKKSSAKINKLVVLAWNDDTTAFSMLYSLTCDDTFNYCMHFLQNEHRAHEAMMAIYDYAYKNITTLEDPTLFEKWLMRISFHECMEIAINRQELDISSMINPATLEALSFSERQIFFLHDYRNLSEDEIANALAIPKKVVTKKLESARNNLLKLKTNAG